MKLLYKIFAVAASMLALSSCVEEAIGDLTGQFPAPTEVNLNTLNKSEATKDADGKRLFVLDLTDGTNVLHATLVGNKYYLTKNTYTEASAAAAKNGNFIIDGQTTVNGKNVIDGSITITQEDANYTLQSLLFVEDGTAFRMSWAGTLTYENDEPVSTTPTIGAYYIDNVAPSMDWTTGTAVAIEGMETHTVTLVNEASETIGGFELVLAAGTTSLAGEWTCQPYPNKDHLMGNGYAFDMGGGNYYVGGSYLKENGEIITVNEGDKFTVTDLGNGVYTFDGTFTITIAPVGYVPEGEKPYLMIETVADTQDWSSGAAVIVDGMQTHTFTLVDDEDKPVAQFELVVAKGGSLEGEYTCQGYPAADHLMGNGYDMMGYYIGGSYYYADGELVLINPGETMTLTINADGSYTFEGDGYSFKGKLAGNEEPTPEPEPEPEPDPEQPGETTTVTITGLALTEKIEGCVDATWQPVAGVESHVISITDAAGNVVGNMQLVLTEGSTDITGTYTVQEYAAADHLAGNGYDAGAWGKGGCYYVNNGTTVLVNPGETVTVTKNADGSYTFAGEGFSLTGNFPFNATGLKLTEKIEGCVDATWQPVAGVESHVISITDAAGNVVGNMQLVLTEGSTDITGTYTVQEYAAADHLAGNGYDAGAWGKGGCYYVNDGTTVLVNPGETVTVTKNADNSFTFAGAGFSLTGLF